MKKLFLISIALITMSPMLAEMVYDPTRDSVYSIPQTPDVNQSEYTQLVCACMQISINMKAANSGIFPPRTVILNQLALFLRNIGGATALRLLADFEKNVIYYPDGSFMRYMWD